MDVAGFRRTLAQPAPPPGLSKAAEALWWDAHGDWDRAHGCAQEHDDATGAAVHAYLHRKEGDSANAGYWYRRAGRPVTSGTLEQEWEMLAWEMMGG